MDVRDVSERVSEAPVDVAPAHVVDATVAVDGARTPRAMFAASMPSAAPARGGAAAPGAREATLRRRVRCAASAQQRHGGLIIDAHRRRLSRVASSSGDGGGGVTTASVRTRDVARASSSSSSRVRALSSSEDASGFGDPNASGFGGASSSAGAEPLATEEDAARDAQRRLMRLEALTTLKDLYGVVVDCESKLSRDYFDVGGASGEDGVEGSDGKGMVCGGKRLDEFAVPSVELEEAMSTLEEFVEAVTTLETEGDLLRSATALLDGKWDMIFDEPDKARASAEEKFFDCAKRVEARCDEMSARLPYKSLSEAREALAKSKEQLAMAGEDQGESQVGARLRPLGRKVGRFTSRKVRSAEGVLGEGLEQLRAKPVGSIQNVAQYSKGVWARINGRRVDDVGIVDALQPFPKPSVKREAREARVLRLMLEVQDRDKALSEAQKARDAIMTQGRSSLLSRVALGDKIRESDEKVSTLRRVFAVRTLQMEMERIMLALEEEVASPPDRLSTAEMDEMALMVAEFGVMDASLRRLISFVDRKESALIDDESLSKLAMEIPDMKSRLAIRDEPGGQFSWEVTKERIVVTVEESIATIREGASFLARGVALLGSDIGTSLRLFSRALLGTTLRPREVQTLRRTFLDVFTFIPFMIILITPITPVGHVLVFGFIQRYFPQLFPSQFTTRRQELMQKYEALKVQLAMAEQAADEADESEALRNAFTAVSTVEGLIRGAMKDASPSINPNSSADETKERKRVEQERMDELRAEINQTGALLNAADDESSPASS